MDPDFDFCYQDGDPFVIGREHLHSDGNKVVSVEAKAFDNGQAGQTALASMSAMTGMRMWWWVGVLRPSENRIVFGAKALSTRKESTRKVLMQIQ